MVWIIVVALCFCDVNGRLALASQTDGLHKAASHLNWVFFFAPKIHLTIAKMDAKMFSIVLITLAYIRRTFKVELMVKLTVVTVY